MKRISFLLSLCLVCIGLAAQGLPSGAADAGNSSKSTLAEGESTETSSWFIDRTGWTVTAQNEYTGTDGNGVNLEGAGSGVATAMLDGNDNTYWHSNWAVAAGINLPLAFTIDLGSDKDIAGFAYLPRPNNGNGTCTRYKMYVHTAAQGAFTGVTTAFNSETGTGWGLTAEEYASPVMQGSFEYIGSRTQKLAASDELITARYILFVSTASNSGQHFTCAEFNLLDGTNNTLTEVQNYVNNTNLDHAKEILRPLVTSAQTFYNTQIERTNANDGLPGYFTHESLVALKTKIDAANALLSQTSVETTDAALYAKYTELQSALQDIRPNVVYPTDVYFTITNYVEAGTDDFRGAIIYDPEKDNESDATNGGAKYLQEKTTPNPDAADPTNPNHLWCFYYNSVLDEYYLYNVGCRKFAGLGHGTYGTTWIFSDSPAAIQLQGYRYGSAIGAYSTTNDIHITGNGSTMSISKSYTGPIITYYADGDYGVPLRFEKSDVVVNTDVSDLKTVADKYSIRHTQDVAEAVLAKTGVGYPVDVEASAKLREAIDASRSDESSSASDNVNTLEAAIDDYKATTENIQMPEEGMAYTITVADNQGNRRFYMNYTNDGYALVATSAQDNTDYPETAKLICRKVGDKYVFTNNAGKYFIFRGKSGEGDGHNGCKGYMDAYDSEWCDLTVEKMVNGGYVQPAAKDLFGYMAIKGKRSNGNISYFIIKVTENRYDQANNTATPYLNDQYSSALLIEEASYANKPMLNAATGIDGIEGIATFSAPFPTVVPEGVKAYYVASADATTAATTLLADAGQAIPAGTGVVLTGNTTGNVTMVPATTEVLGTLQEGTTNLLVATAGEAVTVPADVTAYILSGNGSKVAFFRLSSAEGVSRTIAKNKAYLQLENTQQVIRMRFGDDVTGIDSLTTPAADRQAPVYDLTGRRVMQTVKGGIYIKNGKKFIVK